MLLFHVEFVLSFFLATYLRNEPWLSPRHVMCAHVALSIRLPKPFVCGCKLHAEKKEMAAPSCSTLKTIPPPQYHCVIWWWWWWCCRELGGNAPERCFSPPSKNVQINSLTHSLTHTHLFFPYSWPASFPWKYG